MTVAELIEKLQKCDQNAEVFCNDFSLSSQQFLTRVEDLTEGVVRNGKDQNGDWGWLWGEGEEKSWVEKAVRLQ